jgi:hypothetical protein
MPAFAIAAGCGVAAGAAGWRARVLRVRGRAAAAVRVLAHEPAKD